MVIEVASNHVGNNIQRLRRALNITQKDVSDRTHISESHIAQIEQGVKNPSLRSIQQIAKALNVDQDEWLKLAGEDLLDEKQKLLLELQDVASQTDLEYIQTVIKLITQYKEK